MALPAVVSAVWLTAFELTLDPPETTPPAVTTFARAVADDRIEIAFAHIRAGQDPNAAVPFRDETFTGGRELMVRPLLIAVAHGNTDSVSMLMSNGARLDAPGNRFAVCLATRLQHTELAEKIIEDAGPEDAPTTCPDAPKSEDAPLSAYVE